MILPDCICPDENTRLASCPRHSATAQSAGSRTGKNRPAGSGSCTTARMTVDEAHKRFGTSNDAELVLALLGACGAAEEALRLAKRIIAGEELSDAESLALMEALAGVDKPA